jgi:hypothetical protein
LRFALEVDVSSHTDAERAAMAARVSAAVEGAVAAASGVAVAARLSEVTFDRTAPGQKSVTSYAGSSYEAQGVLHDRRAGAEALTTILTGADPRLIGLWELYLLGARATQTIAPVVGFWAFSNILEEVSGGSNNLKRVPQLLAGMRKQGWQVPPALSRSLDTIRASAVHSDGSLVPPDAEEVDWFRQVARLLLLRRARRR